MSLYNKSFILSILLCLVALIPTAEAAPYRRTGGAQHFLHLSLMGGEANTCIKSVDQLDERGMHTAYPLSNSIGGDAQLELSYEIRKNNFLIGFYGNAHFTGTGVHADSLINSYLTRDIQGDPMYYYFHHTDYQERQRSLWVGGGLRLGWYVLDNMYVAVGAKVEKPLKTDYQIESDLSTSVMWPFAIVPIYSPVGVTDIGYGLYSEEPLNAQGAYRAYNSALMVSPTLEIGAHLHIANRFYMRLAGYVEYGLPVGRVSDPVVLIDYSRVDIPEKENNYIQSRDQLWNGLSLNSAMDYAGSKLDKGRLCVGAKVSFMLDVTTHRERCTTCSDDTGIRYRSRGSHGGGNVWMW